MEYNGEESIWIQGRGHYTPNFHYKSYEPTHEELNGSVNTLIGRLLAESRGMLDGKIQAEPDSDENFFFRLYGWIANTEADCAIYEAGKLDQEARSMQIEEDRIVKDREILVSLGKKYGIELPDLPEELTVVDPEIRLRGVYY